MGLHGPDLDATDQSMVATARRLGPTDYLSAGIGGALPGGLGEWPPMA